MVETTFVTLKRLFQQLFSLILFTLENDNLLGRNNRNRCFTNLKAIELYKNGVLIETKTILDNLNVTANPRVSRGDITFIVEEHGNTVVLVYEYTK